MFKRLFGQKNKTEASTQSMPDTKSSTSPKEKTPASQRSGPGRSKVETKPKPIWSPVDFKVAEVEGKTRFHDLGLEPELLHGIADLGFEYCSAIQAESLPFALKGHDVVGKAQTGTGKTAAFLLAIINDLKFTR